ncbi:hypothetical protein L1987_80954 [Smallanthus sonchifolius]|uniref:Uncharacterized protein n=1 Tax=Smallanthus sonchifolius TaxID=185202 RepID=A0ACB8YP36_9ASTR|nr:hypothetical protein L1987_80954 [Smallanthus sonchifolius]
MAFQLKSFLLLLLLLQLSYGFNGAEETLISNRKLLVVNGLEASFNVASKSRKEEDVGWELRAAPLGPDPLHHHGADPTKPRTP